MPGEHRQVRIREKVKRLAARARWAYFTHPARLKAVITPGRADHLAATQSLSTRCFNHTHPAHFYVRPGSCPDPGTPIADWQPSCNHETLPLRRFRQIQGTSRCAARPGATRRVPLVQLGRVLQALGSRREPRPLSARGAGHRGQRASASCSSSIRDHPGTDRSAERITAPGAVNTHA